MKLRDWLFGTLRRQLAVGVALVHAVMMSVFVFDLVVRQQEVLQARQADEARSLARTLALSARAWVLTRSSSMCNLAISASVASERCFMPCNSSRTI